MKHVRTVAVVMAVLAAAHLAPAYGQEGRPVAGIEVLKDLYKRAPLVVEFQVETVQANPTVEPRLVWEARGAILEVIKGRILPGTISVHVDSIVRVFGIPRAEIAGKQFVLPIKVLGDVATRRFQIIGQTAFPTKGQEADALRQLARTDLDTGSGGQSLQLTVRPIDKVFPVKGSKTLEIRLTNTGKDSATYLQAPISEKDGRLYLTGQGLLRIRDTTGRQIPDKGNITLGMMPPPPPKPALILPGANFVETLDLAKYFDLPGGRYTLVLVLATPDGRGRIPSNGFSFQVGAVNLPEPPEKPRMTITGTPVKPTPPKPTSTTGQKPPTAAAPKPAKASANVPDPASYKPGKPSFGLTGLLRPSKAKYTLGEPVEIEFRLINDGPRTLAVDTRLERTLTIQVQQVDDSPQPLVVRQVIPWPPDSEQMPEERAYLRGGAFWGRTVNLNTLYGKSLDDLPAPTPQEIAAGKSLSYERFAKNLYGFPKPGIYNVTATYTVGKQAGAGSNQPVAGTKLWWSYSVQTNTISIEIAGK